MQPVHVRVSFVAPASPPVAVNAQLHVAEPSPRTTSRSVAVVPVGHEGRVAVSNGTKVQPGETSSHA